MGRNRISTLPRRGISVAFALFALMALAFALNSWLVITSSRQSQGIAVLWSANAVLMFALMGWPGRYRAALYAGAGLASVIANAQAGFAPVVVASYSVANLFEAGFAAWVFQRIREPGLDRFGPRNLLRFVAVAIAATALSATIAVRGNPIGNAAEWQSWFLSDSLGMLLIVPSLWIIRDVWLRRDEVQFAGVTLTRFAAVMTVVIAVSAIVFLQGQPATLFVVAIPMLAAVFEAGRIGAVVSMLVVATIAVVATYIGAGPVALSSTDPVQRVLLLQSFLACQLLMSLPVASLLELRAADARAAIDRERSLRDLAVGARRQAELANRAMLVASAHDELTGLFTRARVMQKLAAHLQKAQRRGELLTIGLFDIDHFKRVNDRFGHVVGDDVLCTVGRIAREALPRRFEIGRIGGEEFMVVMPGLGIAHAEGFAELLRLAIMNGTANQGPCGVTVSIGLSARHQGDTVKSMLIAADLALYRAKSAGRNQFETAA